jgi:PIN domain nuclease of toxin-antitoxin system
LRLLLDTHVWLWSLLEPRRLKAKIDAALRDPDAELWLSPVSIWETLTLARRGRLRLDPDAATWVRQALASAPLEEAPFTMDVALDTAAVVLPHGDPADRMLVATARVFDLTLVTADQGLIDAEQVAILSAR